LTVDRESESVNASTIRLFYVPERVTGTPSEQKRSRKTEKLGASPKV
jgi:hypothetical protein